MATKVSDENSILKRIECLNEIEKKIKENIELLYTFRDNQNKINVIFVTNEDDVYCYGNNANGVLGFGHETPVNEFTINKVLSNKEIIHFKSSGWHTIGRNSDGKLSCWGNDRYLGNGRDNDKITEPESNRYLFHENINDMCCGYSHTLVLTSNKEVYAWGRNNEGQIGNNSNSDVVSKPFKLNEFSRDNVKVISCGWSHSIALTESGLLFSWGNNIKGQLGLNNCNINENKPKQIQIEDDVVIMKISCGKDHSLLLSRDGDIYVFGSNEFGELGLKIDEKKQLTPLKLNHLEKFSEIASHPHYNISAALSKNCLYYIWGNCGEEGVISEPRKFEFKSFNEIFVHFFQITYKSLDFDDGRYRNEFEILGPLGSGSFGKVFKVRHFIEQQEFAIKIINFTALDQDQNKALDLKQRSTKAHKSELKKFREECSKEVQVMEKLRSDYIVHYIISWFENENIFYIQMELCYKALNNVLEDIRHEFNRKPVGTIRLIGYFVYNEIFKETVEALNYLHQQKIIHRDLKPDNILITEGIDGRFVKLGDFGLSVFHQREDHSHTADTGNPKYMAPEVLSGRIYDTNADVYSLGLIAKEIFDFSAKMSIYGSIVSDLIEEMTSEDYKNRPNCQQILNRKKFWYLNIEILNNDSYYKNIIKSLDIDPPQSITACFHKYFIHKKYLRRTREEKEINANELERYDTSTFHIQVSTEVSIKVFESKAEIKGALLHSIIKKLKVKCIIINNIPKEVHMESERFEDIFQQLFFEVKLWNPLTAQKMREDLKLLSEEKSLQKHDALLVMVISHGEEEKILGYNEYQNEDLIEIKEIVNIFSKKNCMTLSQIPKMFFFTCLRKTEEPFIKKRRLNEPVNRIDQMHENRVFPQLKFIDQQWINDNKTTFISYFCFKGNKTFYNPLLGITHFGQALSHFIAQYACEENLQSIMSRTSDFMDKFVDLSVERPVLRVQNMSRQLYFNS